MKLRSVTLREACAFVAQHHEHNEPPRGWRFGVSVRDSEGAILGVGMAGRPPARMIDYRTTIEVTRVCVARVSANKNACSMLYGALCRAGSALGYDEAITYTRDDEEAVSVRAAGFQFVRNIPAQDWNRENRPRRNTRETVGRKLWRRAL